MGAQRFLDLVALPWADILDKTVNLFER